VIGSNRRSKVCAVQNIEEFCPELHFESFSRKVLEYREIHIRNSGPDENVSSRITAEVKTLRWNAQTGVAKRK
jgi:hypothetical protein